MTRTIYDAAADEMEKLLIENNIKYDRLQLFEGWQFYIYNTSGNISGDIICHGGSYGGDNGLWESMGFIWDMGDVSGHLTAHEIINRFKENYGM